MPDGWHRRRARIERWARGQEVAIVQELDGQVHLILTYGMHHQHLPTHAATVKQAMKFAERWLQARGVAPADIPS